jgi:hypothetical protein
MPFHVFPLPAFQGEGDRVLEPLRAQERREEIGEEKHHDDSGDVNHVELLDALATANEGEHQRHDAESEYEHCG